MKKLKYPLPTGKETKDEYDVMYSNFQVDMTNKINEIIDYINKRSK